MQVPVSKASFRVYEQGTGVYNEYKALRSHQTYQFARGMKKKHIEALTSSTQLVDVIDYINKLDEFVDQSDPDLALSNVNHLYQTAQKIRKEGEPEWLQLVGFIHDLGKIIAYIFNEQQKGTSPTNQFAIVGDTYVVGCKLRNAKVFPQLDALCPDMSNPAYNTQLGIYSKNCGLLNCSMSWGHDQFLYDVLRHNRQIGQVQSDFPQLADYIIRHHSLYPWHSFSEYVDFEDETDKLNKSWVQKFCQYDLYTKENVAVDQTELRPYYEQLIKKYFKDGKLVFA